MNNNGYLVPANTKSATLLLGKLRWKPDVIIAGIGTTVSIAALLATQTVGLWATIISLLPMLIAVFLVLPIPNYHNVLCVIQSILDFYNRRKKYIWRGWCMRYEYEKDDKQQ